MSFLPGIFGHSSGSTTANYLAAQDANNARAAGIAAIQDTTNRGIQATLDGRTGAIGAIDAAEPGQVGAINQGYDAATGAYGGARDYFQPYATTGLRGFNLFADSTGANGQGAADASQAAFRESPGYRYQVAQALDGVDRGAAAHSMVGDGGNLRTAELQTAQHLADQGYGNWQSNLQALGQVGYNAAGQQANLSTRLGDLGVQRGQNLADIYGTNAGRRAAAYTGAGQQIAGLYGQSGQAQSQSQLYGSNMIRQAQGAAGQAIDNAANRNDEAWAGIANTGLRFAGAIPTGGLSLGTMGGMFPGNGVGR